MNLKTKDKASQAQLQLLGAASLVNTVKFILGKTSDLLPTTSVVWTKHLEETLAPETFHDGDVELGEFLRIGEYLNLITKDTSLDTKICILTGPLKRTLQTSEAVKKQLREGGYQNVDLEIIPELTHFDQGYLQPKESETVRELKSRYNKAFRVYAQQTFTNRNYGYKFGSPTDEMVDTFERVGESQGEFSERFYLFLLSLLDFQSQNPEAKIVIVGHADIFLRLNELLLVLQNPTTHEHLPTQEWDQFAKMLDGKTCSEFVKEKMPRSVSLGLLLQHYSIILKYLIYGATN